MLGARHFGALISASSNTHGQTFFSFARANEKVAGQDVDHLWNYGLNPWGHNDMVIDLDFISAAGRGHLV